MQSFLFHVTSDRSKHLLSYWYFKQMKVFKRVFYESFCIKLKNLIGAEICRGLSYQRRNVSLTSQVGQFFRLLCERASCRYMAGVRKQLFVPRPSPSWSLLPSSSFVLGGRGGRDGGCAAQDLWRPCILALSAPQFVFTGVKEWLLYDQQFCVLERNFHDVNFVLLDS